MFDLSHLNEFVLQTLFKMETVASMLLSIRERDFLASIDLKDAYFQIPVHQSSRKLLRFLSGGTVYQFRTLCFGLSTAPQVFTRVFAVVSVWAHSHGIRLLRYLDDWLVLASSETEAKKNVQDLLLLCHSLGIVINEEKSVLVPLQTANYLGMTIDTGAARIFSSLAQVKKFLSVAEMMCTMSAPPAQLWQVVLGHLALLERLVPHSRLRMRSLQGHLKTHWSTESDSPSLPVPLSQEVRGSVLVDGAGPSSQGVQFGTPAPDLLLYSDASWSGWGAHLFDRVVSGVWLEQEKWLLINLLEMKALFLAIQSFQELVASRRVTAMCDNSTVVAHVNKQGGTVFCSLCLLASRLLSWTESLDVHLDARAVQCSGRSPQPSGSDYRDRVVSPPAGGEDSASSLELTIDRFVHDDSQCEASPILFLVPDPQAVFEDAFHHPWDDLDLYTFPPFPLVGRVVARVRETPNLSMTLVAPLWPEKEWFADLFILLTQPPLAIPCWNQLLRQPHFNRFHHGLHALNLHA